MFCLVCFDIADDRDRDKMVTVLKDYGKRVQKPVFECSRLNEEQFLKMKYRIEEQIDGIHDSVRYYVLCRECLAKFEQSGFGFSPQIDAYKII